MIPRLGLTAAIFAARPGGTTDQARRRTAGGRRGRRRGRHGPHRNQPRADLRSARGDAQPSFATPPSHWVWISAAAVEPRSGAVGKCSHGAHGYQFDRVAAVVTSIRRRPTVVPVLGQGDRPWARNAEKCRAAELSPAGMAARSTSGPPSSVPHLMLRVGRGWQCLRCAREQEAKNSYVAAAVSAQHTDTDERSPPGHGDPEVEAQPGR